MDRESTVGYRIRKLSLALRNFGERRNGCSDEKEPRSGQCTHLHGWVIGYLYENRERDIYQRDMEKQFSVSRPTMTAILQAMEKNGLILRENDKNDARLKKITLTDLAISIHLEHERDVERFEKRLREGISDEELSVFFDIIDRLTENAHNESERINSVTEK